jgi:hypothetical protein
MFRNVLVTWNNFQRIDYGRGCFRWSGRCGRSCGGKNIFEACGGSKGIVGFEPLLLLLLLLLRRL